MTLGNGGDASFPAEGARIDGGGLSVTNQLTFGFSNTAVGAAILSGGASGKAKVPADFSDFDLTPSALGLYPEREIDGLYVGTASGPPYISGVQAAQYTAMSVRLQQPVDPSLLRINMLIDTCDSPKYSGSITGWSADGSILYVSGWFQQGHAGPGQVPASQTLVINPRTKIRGLHVDADLVAGGESSKGVGAEIALNNHTGVDDINGVMTGINLSNRGGNRVGTGYLAQGPMTNGFVAGNGQGGTGSTAGFLYNPGSQPGAALLSYAGAGCLFAAWTSSRGQTLCGDSATGSLDLGASGVAGQSTLPELRFHSAGGSNAFDAKLVPSIGQAGTNGAATLNYVASGHAFQVGTGGALMRMQQSADGGLAFAAEGGTGSLHLGSNGGNGSVVLDAKVAVPGGVMDVGTNGSTGVLNLHRQSEGASVEYSARLTPDVAGGLAMYGTGGALLGRFSGMGLQTPGLQLTGGGIIPPGAQYFASYDTTNLLSTGGNVTLQNANPWGWGNSATQLCMVQGFFPAAAPPVCPPSGGLNWNGASDFAGYPSIDNFQMSMINPSMPAALTLSGTYTVTSFTPSVALTSYQMAALRPHMQVETSGINPWRSYITSWSPDGSRINVAGWYQAGNATAGQIPSLGSSLYVNPADRIWNLNTIVTLSPGGFASQATGIEIDVDNAHVPNPKSLDIVGILVGGSNGTAAAPYDISSMYAAQGGALNGFESRSGHNAFYLANPATLTGAYNAGFLTYQLTGMGFQAFDGQNGFKFSASAVDGSLDLGAYGLSGSPAQTPAIRFHTRGGTSTAAAATIGASGTGALALAGSNIRLQTNGGTQFEVFSTGPSNNWIGATGSSSGGTPAIVTNSETDSSVDLMLQPKAGLVRLGNAPALTANDNAAVSAAWVKAQGYSTSAAVSSVNGKTGSVALTAADIPGIVPISNQTGLALGIGATGQTLTMSSPDGASVALTATGTGSQSLLLRGSGGGLVSAQSGLIVPTGQLEVGSTSASGYVDWHMAGEAANTDYQMRAVSDAAGSLSFYGNGGVLLARLSSDGLKVASLSEIMSAPPSSSSANCTPGQHAWDTNYEYRCVAPNIWKRIFLQGW
jgi:hypothetical protein